MKNREYLLLFSCELIILLLVGVFQHSPGYMDAEYYFSGGQRLADGHGFSEEILWNYLDDPTGLPHPSHGYWMPLVSILTAIGMAVFRDTSFIEGRIVFILLASAIPPLTALLSYRINQRRDFAILSGLLTVLPGFYLSYLGTTDTFGLSMILGGLFFLLISQKTHAQNFWKLSLLNLGLGLSAGLMHLSRVDGILWLCIIFIYILLDRFAYRKEYNFKQLLLSIFCQGCISILGYVLIMGPWMARNLTEFGSLLSPGGIKSLWITNYNELYAYPASMLTMNHWLDSGVKEIVYARLSAGWSNIQSTLVVEGVIFLTPLMIWGLWKKRETIQVKVAAIAWFGVFIIMTVIFPYQGARGGFFHSSAPFQPLLWAMAPVGLDAFISWGKKVRRWNYSQANKVFQAGIIGLACFISVTMVSKRVIGGDFSKPAWNQSHEYYLELVAKVNQPPIKKEEIVMVNNPPGFYLASNRPCIVVPDGGIEPVMQVASRYHAKYLILEENHPAGMEDLYQNPRDQSGLKYLYSYNDAHIFIFDTTN